MGVTTLSIDNFKGAEEGGEYTVVAKTAQGQAEKKIYLDLADPPVFIEPLQEKTISSKSFLKLVCRVDGIPYPEVRWSKDWKPITGKFAAFLTTPFTACFNGKITRVNIISIPNLLVSISPKNWRHISIPNGP